MADLPEFVYLVTLDHEWPVSAIAGDHPHVAAWVEAEVARRAPDDWARSHAHVWRVRVTDVEEMELLPSATVRASLREKASVDDAAAQPSDVAGSTSTAAAPVTPPSEAAHDVAAQEPSKDSRGGAA